MLKRRKRGMPEVPVASFSDIAFLLIIFFILAAELQQRRYGFSVDLPSGEKSEAQEQKKSTMVSIKDATVALNGTQMPMAELRQQLFALNLRTKTVEADKIVLLESGPGVNYQNYFETMSLIHAAGGIIAIAREPEGGGK